MSWYRLTEPDAVPSPALLVYKQRVVDNIQRMVTVAHGAVRLRPHVKTHKMAEVLQLQQAAGIDKFKCATIAEAEMTGRCRAADVLIAYQPVGPNIGRVVKLVETFPDTRWKVVCDNADVVETLDAAAAKISGRLGVLVDIDNGMHRTGIAPDEGAARLYARLAACKHLRPEGLHVYDGHLHARDFAQRRVEVESAMAPVIKLRDQLRSQGLPVPRIVAGGAFSFPVHAQRPDIELSPGTTVFWDYGYATKIPDLPFEPAVALLTRVIGEPGASLVCLDLGYKAVSSDQGEHRVYFPELPDARMVGQSEEHLVLSTSHSVELQIGQPVYGIPYHVCPTVALHAEGVVIERGRVVDRWPVVARDRRLTI